MTHTDAPIREWIAELKKIGDTAGLQRSSFFADHKEAIHRYLNQPESGPFAGSSPHLKQFLRVASWNIEKGIHWKEIVETLRVEPHLRVADLILLNEVDVGMARSGNHHIAQEMAHALKMNYVFAPAHLELTKGAGTDLEAPGENEVGVQGNAILSHYPLGEAQIIELPQCDNFFQSQEKRYGRRVALKATVFTDKGSLWAVSSHLEVRKTPACRAAQMRAILEFLSRQPDRRPTLLGGDWNTHTFSRGNRWRTLKSYFRIGLTQPPRLIEQLKRPDRHGEGLFAVLREHNMVWEDFNDFADTCGTELPELEDLRFIPPLLHKFMRNRLEQHNYRFRFRLDWFAADTLRALRAQEVTDLSSGIASINPSTLANVNANRPQPLSDHHPILVDISLPPEEATQISVAA
jgi:endonuclease/exonuclease/phosphatase family metal-dependent hydrolase